jgi:cytochrome c peroxidase
MGNASVDNVVARLDGLPDYAGLFEAAFEGGGPSRATIGAALAAYERTLLAAGAPFDRWRFGGEGDAISDAAKRGFALFTGEAGCASCHTVGERDALFSDFSLHATGIGVRAERARDAAARAKGGGTASALRRMEIAPGIHVDFDLDAVAEAAEAPVRDLGRFEVTGEPADRWKYKTPSLRNVALTAPYMHDGSLATLDDVVAFYDAGGEPHDALDARIRPLDLSDGQRDDLVAFLESLTGDTAALVAASEAAPVGDR